MQELQAPVIEQVTAHNEVDAVAHMHRKYAGSAVKVKSVDDISGIGIVTYTLMVWKVKVA